MPAFSRRPSRKTSRGNKSLLQTSEKPGLAVDTSFSRHHGKAPKLVFPPESKPQEVRFVSLMDVKALGNDGRPKPASAKAEAVEQQLNSKVYQPPKARNDIQRQMTREVDTVDTSTFDRKHSIPQSTPLHSRVKGLRPAPLEISPSDRAITIGIAVPPDALADNISFSQPRSGSESTQTACKELPTPTIVITPAREDFDAGLTSSPEDIRSLSGRRPASSVYSGHPSNMCWTEGARTPPVPPLPLFAAQSNASLRPFARQATSRNLDADSTSHLTTTRSQNTLSVQTLFEEDGQLMPLHSVSISRKRSSGTPDIGGSRRSKGWWNVLTSPFSPSGKSIMSYLRSPSLADAEDDQDREPILSGASGMGHSGVAFSTRDPDDDELRSAPDAPMTDACGRTFANAKTRLTPQRSDTAPGALDMGRAAELNIYRRASKGAAASYYGTNKRLTDALGLDSASKARGVQDDGWSPSQSCYRGSELGSDSPQSKLMRDSEFYSVPGAGAAADYYNSNSRFPSLGSENMRYDDKDAEWNPRDSVARSTGDDSLGLSRDRGSIALSPKTSFMASPAADLNTTSGDQRTAAPPYPDPPYPDNGPFDDSNAAGFVDLDQVATRGYNSDLTPNSGEVTAFKDFSGTHPAAHDAAFPPSPNGALSLRNPGPDEMQHNNSEDVFSPMETPQVEEAKTATFIGPDSHREIEVASTRQRGANSPAYGAGLGIATMSTQDAIDGGSDYAREPMPENTAPHWPEPHQASYENQGSGFSDYDSERDDEAESQECSEKPGVNATRNFQTSNEGSSGRKPRRSCSRRCFCAIAGALCAVAIILFAVLFTIYFPFRSAGPIEAVWLNLTGFPPLPTGVATVIQPKPVQQVSGCVSQQALWSCAMPTGEQNEPGKRTVPDFKFQFRFRGDILPANETAIEPSNTTISRRGLGHASGASEIARRGVWTNWKWSSSPSPPSTEDQKFLGRTTDNITAPHDGEQTPFYISLLNASSTITTSGSSKLRKREFHYPYPTPQTSNSTEKHSGFRYPSTGESGSGSSDSGGSGQGASTSAADSIPHAATTGSGSPAAAALYPLSYAQPLRLFDRGLSSEHYGFYTYFDRSLYVSDLASSTISNNDTASDSAGGNVPLDRASAVCTWSQTRFLVQIWTRKQDVTWLNGAAPTDVTTHNSTANDMTAPGSFPYPVTITLDRHGGEADEKGVYCHALDDEEHVEQDVRTWIAENRAFGGELVNPAAVPTNNGTILNKRGDGNGPGGVDGGQGGCRCQWQNW